MSIQHRFQSLSLFQKFELYIIVFILFFLLFYFKDIFIIKKDISFDETNRLKSIYEKKIDLLTKSFTILSNNKIRNLIYKKADLLNIKIEKFKNLDKTIDLGISSSSDDLFLFLDYITQHFIVKKFHIKKLESSLDVALILDKRYYFKAEEKNQFKNISDPFFYKQNLLKEDIKVKNKYLLKAIVFDNLFINDKWYKVGQSIDHFIIKSVKENKATLYNKNQNQYIFIEVFNDG